MLNISSEPRVSTLALKLAKYTAVGRITVRNHLAYIYDFLIRSLFLLVILYVFIQLWSVTYDSVGTTTIAGYTYEQIIWYLIFAEAFVLAAPKVSLKVEEEVLQGDIGYQLTRPMNYLLYHYASYMGEALVRVAINLVVGGLLGLLLFGWPDFGFGWLGFLILMIGSYTVHYLITMIVGLCALWVEEVRGIDFVYNKLLFTIGGMMIPLEMMPEMLQKVCEFLPFQAIVYFAAKTAVQFDLMTLWKMLGIQALWAIVISLLLRLLYARGVKKLNVNGG
ncbi:ABC transporter permease [Tumebacillus algifaecis]|uniref:ABC transporter permease n=1 Tax=Tumebacillus algifaecis TaxID=1214604 RepID=UPI001D131EA1|nr:ABC-2 family transporter protein [Tumebacillus algifaecis]